jgi:hypothetical protein
MNNIFYALHLFTQLAMIGCCFRGLCRVMTIYVHCSSNLIGSVGYKTHKNIPCLYTNINGMSYIKSSIVAA